MSFAIDRAYIKILRGFPAHSEIELIEQTIEFANTGSARAYALLLSSVRMSKQDLASTETFLSKRPPSSSWPALIENERLMLSHGLATIVAGNVPPALYDMWCRRAEGLALLPTFSDKVSVRCRYVVFENFLFPPSPQFAYTQLLLLSRPQGAELCRCKLQGCGRFFLAARPASSKVEHRGRTIKDYCPGTDHRELAHQAAAVERMRQSRARAKARAAINQKRRR
jgi:hypothetical protein